MKEFCPSCGKSLTSKKSIKGFCVECFLKDNKLVFLPQIIKTRCCSKCNRLWFKSRWIKFSEENLEKIVAHNMKTYLDDFVAIIKIKQVNESNFKVFVRIKGFFEGKQIFTFLNSMILLVKELCDECMKLSSDYFEAVLQLRTIKENRLKEMHSKINNLMNGLQKKFFLAKIVKEKKVKGGLDLYVASNKAAKSIALKLKPFLIENLKCSSKLVGIKRTGKEKKRYFYSLKF